MCESHSVSTQTAFSCVPQKSDNGQKWKKRYHKSDIPIPYDLQRDRVVVELRVRALVGEAAFL